jgi:ribonucleoside-diphosphate reductase alpha chain
LQYGVPLQVLVDKFSHVRFEPSGYTKNPDIRIAKSIVDYIVRWMATKFLSPEAQYRAGVNTREVNDEAETAAPQTPQAPARNLSLTESATVHLTIRNQEDAPPCPTCGSIMIRSGACYKCANCGTTSGCA